MKNACARKRNSLRPRAPINPESITAVVLARNEASNLPRLLDSLPAAMPVLVLDHRSTDETAAIARARGARVIERDFDGFVNARRFALSQVETPWTLMIDADEALDDRLRASIVGAGENFDGYYVRRSTFFCGRALRMWRDEKLLRLFRTDSVRLEAHPVAGGSAQLHEHWLVAGATAVLGGTLLHHSYPTVASYLCKFSAYTAIEAEGAPILTVLNWVGWFVVLPLRFAYLLVVRRALLDGWRGIFVAFYSALYPIAVGARRLQRLLGARRS